MAAYIYIYMNTAIYIDRYKYILKKRTYGKQQFSFVCCKLKMKTANLRWFSAFGNGEWKFVYLGGQPINGNSRLLSQHVKSWTLFHDLGGCTYVVDSST
jgi:hypothetical protein